MKIWICKYTGELIVGSPQGGRPLFGGVIPFIGFKKLSCDSQGFSSNGIWPPEFLTMQFGVMWFGVGRFWNPPWHTEIKAVR